MTKSQIKAELRRMACNSNFPAFHLRDEAYEVVNSFRISFEKENPYSMRCDDQRTFFLLVAEAL